MRQAQVANFLWRIFKPFQTTSCQLIFDARKATSTWREESCGIPPLLCRRSWVHRACDVPSLSCCQAGPMNIHQWFVWDIQFVPRKSRFRPLWRPEHVLRLRGFKSGWIEHIFLSASGVPCVKSQLTQRKEQLVWKDQNFHRQRLWC